MYYVRICEMPEGPQLPPPLGYIAKEINCSYLLGANASAQELGAYSIYPSWRRLAVEHVPHDRAWAVEHWNAPGRTVTGGAWVRRSNELSAVNDPCNVFKNKRKDK
jgi:hypothetical protein